MLLGPQVVGETGGRSFEPFAQKRSSSGPNSLQVEITTLGVKKHRGSSSTSLPSAVAAKL